MKLEKVAFYSSVVLFGAVLFKELFGTKIKLRTMAIRRTRLQQLVADKQFQALYFNPFYDSRDWAKDHVSLVSYRRTAADHKPLMVPEPLQLTGKPILFSNQKDYSTYQLLRENLETILHKFSDPEVVYVLFKPQLYAADESYFAYQLLPGDALMNPIEAQRSIEVMAEPVRALHMAGADATSRPSASLLSLSAQRDGIFLMNPSPPATHGFQEL